MKPWVIYAPLAQSLDGRQLVAGQIIESRRCRSAPIVPEYLAVLEVSDFKPDYDETHVVIDGALAPVGPAEIARRDPGRQVRGLRLERTRLLDETAWTQAADAPLTAACSAAYRDWRVRLHRWLVDYPDGQTPLPAPPGLVFLPLDQQV